MARSYASRPDESNFALRQRLSLHNSRFPRAKSTGKFIEFFHIYAAVRKYPSPLNIPFYVMSEIFLTVIDLNLIKIYYHYFLRYYKNVLGIC